MKKQYIKPTVSVMNLNCEGVLCSSFNDGETHSIGVRDEEGEGNNY